MAIGDGSPGNWELFQFRDARMVSARTWNLSHRLRGQLGSDAVQPLLWPIGSRVVLLDGIPQQIALSPAKLRLVRHFRIGPAQRALDDPTYVHEMHAFDGVGLRPYSPVHLTVSRTETDLLIRWIRRTRVEGDSWDLAEVPLGEESERYLIRLLQGETIVREAQSTSPVWLYTGAMQGADETSGPLQIAVAQISARFGPGPFRSVLVEP